MISERYLIAILKIQRQIELMENSLSKYVKSERANKKIVAEKSSVITILKENLKIIESEQNFLSYENTNLKNYINRLLTTDILITDELIELINKKLENNGASI